MEKETLLSLIKSGLQNRSCVAPVKGKQALLRGGLIVTPVRTANGPVDEPWQANGVSWTWNDQGKHMNTFEPLFVELRYTSYDYPSDYDIVWVGDLLEELK